jgi:hypothetical protein
MREGKRTLAGRTSKAGRRAPQTLLLRTVAPSGSEGIASPGMHRYRTNRPTQASPQRQSHRQPAKGGAQGNKAMAFGMSPGALSASMSAMGGRIEIYQVPQEVQSESLGGAAPPPLSLPTQEALSLPTQEALCDTTDVTFAACGPLPFAASRHSELPIAPRSQRVSRASMAERVWSYMVAGDQKVSQ